MSFWYLQISQKKTNEIFSRISALASKERSNKKVVQESQNEITQLVVYKVPLFFYLKDILKLTDLLACDCIM